MAILLNSRHEKFSQLVASGIQPAAAYTSLGYSSKGAPQSANNLRKRSDVRGRVDEIRQAAAISTAAEIAFDQQRVLNRLDVLSHKAEDLGQISVAVRCEELIGKHRGMFIDRQVAEVAISSEPSIAEVLRMRRAKREEREKAAADGYALDRPNGRDRSRGYGAGVAPREPSANASGGGSKAKRKVRPI